MQVNSSNVQQLKTSISNPRVGHVVASINENVGGTAFFVTSLASAINNQGLPSNIFTLDYQEIGKQIVAENVNIYSYPATFLAKNMRGFHPQASHALSQLASAEFDLIHNHGLWMFPNLYARQAALKNNLPLIISPHGMLESWSLTRSRLKKFSAWLLYEQKNLNSATIFHATSDEEVKSIRNLGFQQPIAFIPSGVHLADCESQPSREVLTQLFPELAEKKWLLFFSRLHPKKGIDNLLYVWQKLVDQFLDWHLIIAGPDLIGYQEKLELLVEKLNLRQQVTFTGMLSGQEKSCALSNAGLFVLPTHSENFGIAIAESLAYGVPVITTKGAPWQDLQHYGCGWWIEDNQEALKVALVEAMQISAQERKAMGLKGQHLIETKYSWNSIAKEMANVYRWIIGGGELPNCVQLYNS
ncbi:MAG: glycosyltransferase [Mojavia pulchra JT2-VF2]|jgi:glycosyltransferase involved in cell wall biosynthesis|uniref:Glycosyltransferase n=1 Tax=Mojavia pulchra JT2-VF2 TaxID=287848 RepID=A0A951UFA9_9NOST|nr:glycosyltransferase [Mojavia pulchra JT2-VF2]